MARKPRQRSLSGIYHVILRGNNKQNIFEDEEDRTYFLNKMFFYKKECGFEIYAYCLMDNHVHLLIKEKEVSISNIIKRLAGSYAYWFNRKYDRVGHLYQDRFRSEPVEDERYFLSVLRYIHNNPVVAGLAADFSEYRWSSYNEYFKRNSEIDVKLCYSMMDRERFILFHNKKNNDSCLEVTYTVFRFMTDSVARNVIKSIMDLHMVKSLSDIKKSLRNSIIRQFREAGLSIKQINRLTGISIGIIKKQKITR